MARRDLGKLKSYKFKKFWKKKFIIITSQAYKRKLATKFLYSRRIFP